MQQMFRAANIFPETNGAYNAISSLIIVHSMDQQHFLMYMHGMAPSTLFKVLISL